MSIEEEIVRMATATHEAARQAAILPMPVKEKILMDLAGKLRDRRSFLRGENRKDLEIGKEKGLSSAMMDRLTLSDKVIDQTAAGIEEIAAFPDPVGEIVRKAKRVVERKKKAHLTRKPSI